MWFILEAETERTLGMTHYQDVAIMMAESFPVECILRYTEKMEYGSYTKNSTYFENSKEMKKGA